MCSSGRWCCCSSAPFSSGTFGSRPVKRARSCAHGLACLMPADVRSLHDTECASCMRVALVPCGVGQEAPPPPPPLTTAGSARSKTSLSGSTWRTRWSLPRTLASGDRPPKVRRPHLVLRRLPSRHPVLKRRPRLLRPRLRTQGLSCPTPQKKCASRETNPWRLELPPASDSAAGGDLAAVDVRVFICAPASRRRA